MKLNLRALSITVAVCLAMIGGVQLQDPASLGVSAVAIKWLSIIAIGLGILQGFLPRVQGPTKDPRELANRVWKLPEEDKRTVGRILAARAERAKGRSRPTVLPPAPEVGVG